MNDGLDKAFDIIAPFDTLIIGRIDSLAYSEINVLKASIYSAKIFAGNAMIRGPKYGKMAEKSLNTAIKFYSKNPRIYFLDGQGKYYMPSFIGGGIDKALPLLKTAIEYYDEFQPEKYWPDWGREDCQVLYDKALDEKE